MTNFLLLVLAKARVDLGTDVLRRQLIHTIDVLRDAFEGVSLRFDLLLGLIDGFIEAIDKTIRGEARSVLPTKSLFIHRALERYLCQDFSPILGLLAFDQLSHSYILDSQLQVVHLRVVKHNFVILDFLGLKLVKGFGNNGVVHRQTLMLSVVFLCLLKLFHEHVLFVEKKLLSRALDQLTVDFLGQKEHVVERAWRSEPGHLDFKLINSLLKRRLLAKLDNVIPIENFDDGLRYEAKVHLEPFCPLENALVVDDRATEQPFKHDVLPIDVQVDFGNAVLKDVNLVNWVADLLVGSLRRLNCLHLVDHIVENGVCVLKVCKEGQLPQRHLDECHVLVIVLENAFLDALENLGILVAHIVKVFFGHLSNGRVLLRNNGGRGHAVVDEGDLTKELALEQSECLALTFSFLGAWLLTAGSQCGAPVLRSVLHVQVATTEVHGAFTFCNDE